jgi:hypothetical protein
VAEGAPPPREAAPPAPGSPPGDERHEIWSLLDHGQLDRAAARIGELVAQDPKAPWPRFVQGALFFHRYWRPDCVKQWQFALARDPEIAQDPQFGAYLCLMLDPKWQEAGAAELVDGLGVQAVPLLQRCVDGAKSPSLRRLAERALARHRRR